MNALEPSQHFSIISQRESPWKPDILLNLPKKPLSYPYEGCDKI